MMLRWALAVALPVGLAAACTTQPPETTPTVSLPASVGIYKIGEPYQENGTWYYPREQLDYDETGLASWYGPTFHGHRTANGEVFDANGLTAAHRTLPMPVNVRITNLENGASLIVRVNDRGPFAKGRIIDVSAHAAQLLGFYAKGTAKVRVTYLSRADLPGGVEAPPLIAAAPTTTIQTAALNPVDSTPAPTEATPLHPYEAPPAESAQPAAAPANEAPPPDAAAEAPPAADEPSPGATAITELPPPPAKTSSLPPPPTEAVLGTQPTGKVTEVAVPAVTHLYVQAGAFLQRQNAERQRAKYAAAGGLTISPIDRGNHRLYRVRIGPFDDVGAADAALARLTGLGSDDARIVVDR